MMKLRFSLTRYLVTGACVALLAAAAAAQGVKRVVVIKIDGLPGYYVDQFVKEKDPETGKSVLPWIEEVFYKNGSRVPNFYTRGMSLSGPSWGQIETGQHLQIRGNVEYDRYTLHAYDYLNFFPFYMDYGLGKKVDMPAVEVLDQLETPLLFDVFPFEKRYISNQLYQRGNRWEILAGGFIKLYPGNVSDFIDEWTLGLEFRKVTVSESERDIIASVVKQPEIDYYDYYDANFDHLSHHNSDTPTRLGDLKQLDRTIGRIWNAIRGSSRYDETALILVSDHGFNSEEKVYSQGFNLVNVLGSPAGGGHHVITKRRLMLDYSVKGFYPLVPLITTSSKYSYYLKGQGSDYPTALLDFDGNERASIHLRNSELNKLHIIFEELQDRKLAADLRSAATAAFFDIIDKHRAAWQQTIDEMSVELEALHRYVEARPAPKKGEKITYTPEQKAKGLDQEARRKVVLGKLGQNEEERYISYLTTLKRLLSLDRASFDPRKIKAAEIISPKAMGESNSLHDLQNYIVGVSPRGLTVGADGRLDLDASFTRVNYFDLLQSQRVRNNVQKTLSNRPVDFTAVRIPGAALQDELPERLSINEDPIWLYAGADKQALILSRRDSEGQRRFFLFPVSGLTQDAAGKITYAPVAWTSGLPLRYFEDPDLAIPAGERAAWFNEWHSEVEWLNAIHRTRYSNALIGLNEQLGRNPIFDRDDGTISDDERRMRHFRTRQRHLSEADLLVLANDHWNFDVKGFNPGGNHGSFFRVSTNSTLMMAGGAKTGIPRGLAVEAPYDGMSFMPTLMRLMGKTDDDNAPGPELRQLGFRKFPGRVISEITEKDK